MKRAWVLALPLTVAALAGAARVDPAFSPSPTPTIAAPADSSEGIHKIRHVVIIMQENRSFDSYFGTYPGADGIQMQAGVPTACVPDPAHGTCVRPYHDPNDLNRGGPHGLAAAVADIDGGKMDGFIARTEAGRMRCVDPNDPRCAIVRPPDVMGYHDRGDIPIYWRYADEFVLQDRMFEPNASWSLPEHLYMVSEWSARCSVKGDASSCRDALDAPALPPDFGANRLHLRPDYAWTDLTYLLHNAHVSWAYYVVDGTEPDCANGDAPCSPGPLHARTPGIWNPLPYFDTVRQDGELENIRDLGQFYRAAAAGTLPAVSWICPSNTYSEHPPALVSDGQAYVAGLVNAIMRGPDWNSTAIFISWDDWGGFYDHVPPPIVDQNGYGLRVPGLVISAFAKHGLIDHQSLSFDAYVKFIEDDFLQGARIDPKTDGRPDPRPDVREREPQLGDLRADFDFGQPPRSPAPEAGGITIR